MACGRVWRISAACDDRRMTAPTRVRGGQRRSCRIQSAVLDRRRWDTREGLRIAIVTWIQRTYHRRRRQTNLGRLTPIEFEAIVTTPASQAA